MKLSMLCLALVAAFLHQASAASLLRGSRELASGYSVRRFLWYPSNAQTSFAWSTSGLSAARPIVMIPWYSGSCTSVSQVSVSQIANSFCSHFGKCEVYMVPQQNLGTSTLAAQVSALQQCLSGVSGQPKVTGVMCDTEGIKVDTAAYWSAAKGLGLETGFIKGGMSVAADSSLSVNAAEFYGPVQGTCTAWGARPTCNPTHSSSNCYSSNGGTYGTEIANMVALKDTNVDVTAFAGGCGSGGCGVNGQAADCALAYDQLPAAVNAYFKAKPTAASLDFGVYA